MSDAEPVDDAEPASVFELLDLDAVADEAEPDIIAERNGLVVTGTDAQEHRVDLESLCRVAVSVLATEEVTRGRLDLHLVDREAIAELNAEHLDGEGPTDVLSFPLGADEFVDPPPSADLPPLIADVVICPEVAIEQAPGHAGSPEVELILLTVHGVLHALGHDHAEEAERLDMQARERAHLAALGFDHPVPEP